MAEGKLTLGNAIDTIINVLQQLDERARDTALAAACAHMGLASPQASTQRPAQIAAGPAAQAPETSAGFGHVRSMDIRSLKEEKQPQSAKQMALLVAFYLQEVAPVTEQKPAITSADIEKYFKQAGHKLPVKLGQLLIDLKADGYLDSTGRGEYKLNAVGYNLVAHGMPTKSE